MSLWLLSADGGASMPVGEVRELFVICRAPDAAKRRAQHEFQVCASKTGERTGPYRVLATIPAAGSDDEDAEDAALGALEELTMLLADDATTGVLRWADAWMLQVGHDPDTVVEGGP